MAEILNRFFASVFTKEDISNIPVCESETDVRLENVVFTTNKIRDKIKGLKPNSAPGPDSITVSLLQAVREELLAPLIKFRNCPKRLERSHSHTNFQEGDKRRGRKL